MSLSCNSVVSDINKADDGGREEQLSKVAAKVNKRCYNHGKQAVVIIFLFSKIYGGSEPTPLNIFKRCKKLHLIMLITI